MDGIPRSHRSNLLMNPFWIFGKCQKVHSCYCRFDSSDSYDRRGVTRTPMDWQKIRVNKFISMDFAISMIIKTSYYWRVVYIAQRYSVAISNILIMQNGHFGGFDIMIYWWIFKLPIEIDRFWVKHHQKTRKYKEIMCHKLTILYHCALSALSRKWFRIFMVVL